MAKEGREGMPVGVDCFSSSEENPVCFQERKGRSDVFCWWLLNGYEQGEEKYSGDFTQRKVREKVLQAAFGGKDEKPSGDTTEGKKKGKCG